jgi:DNA-binding transcriptional MerR regulator
VAKSTSISEAFSLEEVARLTGINVDALTKWIRTRFISPSVRRAPGVGRSNKHLFSFRDVVALRVAVELRARGISLAELRKVIAYVKSRSGLSASDALASTLLVTDGHDVYEVSDGASFSALRAPGQRVLCIVPLATLVSEVQRGVRALSEAA